MKNHIIILLFSPLIILAQEQIEIKHLSKAINSVGAELSFFQDEKTHAFFTAIRDDNNDYVSSIYATDFQLGQWSKGSYFHVFNSDFMQSGNLFLDKDKVAYFTFCKADICAIYRSNFKNEKWTKPKKLDERINQKESTSTQPTIAEINGKKFLYFVSDREGGFGGTDIWVCTIDSSGNFGNPVNCGNKINSKANEITPFFNPNDGQLYFSSDRKNGIGGFDIFASKGDLTLWENVTMLPSPFNSSFDDMYFNFHTENRGYFSSNRPPSYYLDKENCCNDIFTFEIIKTEKQTPKVIETINPSKDVDGFHPMNVGNLSSGYESSIPCTPLGCYLLIKNIEKNLNGKHAVIIGRSNLNGKPMAQLLLKENCTVTITHSKTKDLKAECARADIIIAAVGRPKLVKADWVKKDAIVIDVGINKTDSGLVGDVDFDGVSKVAKAITPVPGGVGPMTIACLLSNTVECFEKVQSN